MIPRHHGASGLGCAQVDCLMRDARRHKQKVARLADDFVFELNAPACANHSLENVDACLVADVEMRGCPCSGRNDDQVHRQARGAHGLARDAYEVRQPLLGHDLSVRTKRLYLGGCIVHGVDLFTWRLKRRLGPQRTAKPAGTGPLEGRIKRPLARHVCAR